ncbi:uncharacterized protein LOC143796606 [Ranitomeya variabilis]|uniref:uncharacterized protein LOC143796606 n=1 Tax=Ranitomeya variabilis TaxID=490064 RepID=UPI00405646D2
MTSDVFKKNSKFLASAASLSGGSVKPQLFQNFQTRRSVFLQDICLIQTLQLKEATEKRRLPTYATVMSLNQDAAVVETTDESQEEDEDATDKEESSHQSGQEEESESDINSETYISSAKKSSHDTVRRSTRQRQTGLQTSTRAVKRKEIISKEKKDSCPTHKLMSKEEHFKRFTKKYPITLEKDVPSPSICREESRTNWRYFGDRWRKIQNKMRVDHITGMLQKSNVKISEVERHIENQGWKRNLPRVTDILHQLKK